jgi:hypothetical protein
MHPGSHVGAGIEQGLKQLTKNLDRAFEKAAQATAVMVLLETTAGQGTVLGSRFEELAYIISYSKYSDRLGVCYDTCHTFAAGYDISTKKGYRKTFSDFESIIGLDRLKFFHLNDSKKELGSRVDRHDHIGKGKIGLTGFRQLLNDPRFAAHPMVLETPKEKDLKEDIENLKLLGSLVSKNKSYPFFRNWDTFKYTKQMQLYVLRNAGLSNSRSQYQFPDKIKHKGAPEQEKNDAHNGSRRDSNQPGLEYLFGNAAVNTSQTTGQPDSHDSSHQGMSR